MQDNRPEIVLDGDISPFRQKLREAGEALKNFGNEGESALGRMTGPLGDLQKRFVAIGAVLAGGKVFAAAVDESKKLVSEANSLGRVLAISTTEASALNIALGDIYSSADEFIGASQQLGRQLRTNEDDLKAMGLVTRDSNGEFRNLKDLMFDSLDVLRGYKEGTDRNLAAQVLFGRGAGEITGLLKLQRDGMEDARKKAEELGLAISVQNAEAVKKYKAAMNDAGDVTSALKKAAGDQLIPVLTQLGEWFAAIGPAAVVVVRGALGGLMSVFWGLYNVVNILWSTLNAMATSVSAPLMALSSALGKAIKGDFAGAAEDLKAVPGQITDAWSTAFDEIVASSEKTRDKLSQLFLPGDAAAAKSSDGRSYIAPPDKDKKKKEKEESMLPKWEAELAAMKDAFEQENLLRQFSKQQELDFWRSKLATAEKGGKDYLALAKRVSTLSLEIRRQEAKEAVELEQVKGEGARRSALFAIEQEEQAARFARENGEITKLQLLQLEESFLQRRFEIERKAAQERLTLLENDPTQSPAALERARQAMLEIEERYKLKKSENKQQQGKQEGSWGNFFDGISSSFGNAIDGMLTKGQTLQQGMLQIFGGIRDAFLKNVVIQPFTEWVAMQGKKLAMLLGFSRAEQGQQQASAVQSMATVANQATAEVGSKGASAAAGSAQAMSGIPIVGPVLAAAAFAATLAMVLGARSSIRSASRGFDIPAGLNPLTQLHEQEMVLPAEHANTIRKLAAGGDQGGAAAPFSPTVVVQAMNSRDVQRALLDGGALNKALKDLARSFANG